MKLALDIVNAMEDGKKYYLDLWCDQIMDKVKSVGYQYDRKRQVERRTLVTHLQQATVSC